MDQLFAILTPILNFLVSQYGVVGKVIFYVVVLGGPIMSILLDVAEFVVSLTDSPDDDAEVSKIRGIWDKVWPYLEVLPHSNLPISQTIVGILSMAKKIAMALKGAASGFFSK